MKIFNFKFRISNFYGVIAIFVVGFIPLIDLFQPGLPITHDGQDHVARIANFYQSLSEGNLVPRWAANLNWGYGHPILMFLYPLPSYLASGMHALGFSFVDSLKILFGISFIASGITMYLWIRNALGEKAGILAGVLYMLAPYRLVDLYVRGAIGEHIAFVFGPLVCYFLFKLSIEPSKKLYAIRYTLYASFLSFSVSGLLLSHNAIAIMFLPIIIAYALYLIYHSKQRKLLTINYLLFTLLGFGLSSFFLLPAFFEGKYTLRDIVTNHGEYKQGFVSLLELIVPSWSYGGTAFLTKQIGIAQIVGILASLVFIVQKRGKDSRIFFGIFAVFFSGALALMLPFTDIIWSHVSLLQKFQFPWRFLSVIVFTTAILSSMWVIFVRKRQTVLVLVAILSCLILYSGYFHARSYLQKPESFYTGIYNSTTDTGESSPIWSIRFMEKRPKTHAEVIDGVGTIQEITRSTTQHTYKIEAKTNIRVRENTIYFPGWKVIAGGAALPIEFQDAQNRGLITYYLPSGKHTVTVLFEDTRLRKLANYISLFSGIVFLGMFVYLYIKLTKKR